MVLRKNKVDIGKIKTDPNAWMVTFADLTMLLLTFFVMLLTMKSMEIGKARRLFVHSEGPLDYVAQNEQLGETGEDRNFINAVAIESTEGLDKAIDVIDGIEFKKKKDSLGISLRDVITEITENERGVSISLKADDLFDSGKAEIREDRLHILDAIGQLFRYATNDILVMGHTDNLPITNDRFRSNLELSVYRGLNVLYHLTNNKGIKPERLAAGGYGDSLPRYPNDSTENRAKNRRVEFILRKAL